MSGWRLKINDRSHERIDLISAFFQSLSGIWEKKHIQHKFWFIFGAAKRMRWGDQADKDLKWKTQRAFFRFNLHAAQHTVGLSDASWCLCLGLSSNHCLLTHMCAHTRPPGPELGVCRLRFCSVAQKVTSSWQFRYKTNLLNCQAYYNKLPQVQSTKKNSKNFLFYIKI